MSQNSSIDEKDNDEIMMSPTDNEPPKKKELPSKN